MAHRFYVSPGYFAVAGTPLLEGRDFTVSDTTKTPAVALVNRRFARQLFHSDNAVGLYFKDHDGLRIQIVGMVADGKYLTITGSPASGCVLSHPAEPHREDRADRAAAGRRRGVAQP